MASLTIMKLGILPFSTRPGTAAHFAHSFLRYPIFLRAHQQNIASRLDGAAKMQQRAVNISLQNAS